MQVALLLLAYLLGSVPTGLVLTRLAGRQNVEAGVGGTGSSWLAAAVLVADAVKGIVPVLLARRLSVDPALAAGVAVLTVLGHTFPLAPAFTGNKGMATALGALSGLCPSAAPWVVAVFLFAFALDRHLSFASLLAALAAPVAIAIQGYPIESLGAGLLMAALVVARHRDNLRRLRAGTEPRFKLPKRQAPPQK